MLLPIPISLVCSSPKSYTSRELWVLSFLCLTGSEDLDKAEVDMVPLDCDALEYVKLLLTCESRVELFVFIGLYLLYEIGSETCSSL